MPRPDELWAKIFQRQLRSRSPSRSVYPTTMTKIQLPMAIAPRLSRPARSSRLAKQRRSYYSEAYPEAPPFPAVEATILSAALHHVPRHGFTSTALTLGAKDAGYPDVSVQLFPKGPFNLIEYYLTTQRLGLKDRVHFQEETKLGIAAKVRALAWARLHANKDIIHQWQGVSSTDLPPSKEFPSCLIWGRCHFSLTLASSILGALPYQSALRRS
jgi:hypothetical protein